MTVEIPKAKKPVGQKGDVAEMDQTGLHAHCVM
jgi:hypothetical protein